jgi:hypothetical protein
MSTISNSIGKLFAANTAREDSAIAFRLAGDAPFCAVAPRR